LYAAFICSGLCVGGDVDANPKRLVAVCSEVDRVFERGQRVGPFADLTGFVGWDFGCYIADAQDVYALGWNFCGARAEQVGWFCGEGFQILLRSDDKLGGLGFILCGTDCYRFGAGGGQGGVGLNLKAAGGAPE
jgi:hypothetical protein